MSPYVHETHCVAEWQASVVTLEPGYDPLLMLQIDTGTSTFMLRLSAGEAASFAQLAAAGASGVKRVQARVAFVRPVPWAPRPET